MQSRSAQRAAHDGSKTYFNRRAIGPILLLTAVTSFAFNHALITTERKEELRRHRIQLSLLQDVLDYRTRQLYRLVPPAASSASSSSSSSSLANSHTSSSWSWFTRRHGSGDRDNVTIPEKENGNAGKLPQGQKYYNQEGDEEEEEEEKRDLVRRLHSVGLDPIKYGLLPSSSSTSISTSFDPSKPSSSTSTSTSTSTWTTLSNQASPSTIPDEPTPTPTTKPTLGPREITWSEIFFGSKQSRSSLRENWARVATGIRDSFASLRLGLDSDQTRPSLQQSQHLAEQERKELESLQYEWNALLSAHSGHATEETQNQ
ncbi:hypothetical protein BCV70DRAFT_200219 [Testicularia cyperi]|uniref:Uncharacterized protein n=1 Tax=Testicularia cyperi TaxID=1882483 RepID=A0A317XP43_9BASI|nr:hypothetical protein BCV70DRAFT_200219 [Testicularia cyperi]